MFRLWQRAKLKRLYVLSSLLLVGSFAFVASPLRAELLSDRSSTTSTIDSRLLANEIPAPAAPIANTATTLGPADESEDPEPAEASVERLTNPSCYTDVSIAIAAFYDLFEIAPTESQVVEMIEAAGQGSDFETWFEKYLPSELAELDNASFIQTSYENVRNEGPGAEALERWLGEFENGSPRTQLVKALFRHNTQTSHFCEFVQNHGGGEQVSPGIIYQETGVERIVFVDRTKIDRTFATSDGTGLERTPDFAARNNLDVAINTNWALPNGDIDGFVVSNGNVYGGDRNRDTGQSLDHDWTALFGFTDDNEVHTRWHGEVYDAPPPNIETAISGHPSLTHKGQLATDFGLNLGPTTGDPYTILTPNARSAIGVSKSGDVVIIAGISGRPGSGYSVLELAKMMHRVGAAESVMLDGSGSTSLVVKGEEVTNSHDRRKVLVNFGLSTGDWFAN